MTRTFRKFAIVLLVNAMVSLSNHGAMPLKCYGKLVEPGHLSNAKPGPTGFDSIRQGK